MNRTKQQVNNALAMLTSDFTPGEAHLPLDIEQGLKEAEADVAAGRVFTHQQAKQIVAQWRKPDEEVI